MLRKILFFSLLSLLTVGCIKENMDNCHRGLRLRFSYTYNDQGQDLLAEQVQDIRVYVFDRSTELLADMILIGPADIGRGYIDADIPDGLYTFVAWGFGSEDMMLGGYAAQATVGITTLDDFRMMLTYGPLSGNAWAEAVPQNPDFDNLFFSIAEDIAVDRAGNQTVDFNFIQNTSTLKVIVTGLEYLTTRGPLLLMPLDVFTTGRNWLYGYDNRLDTSASRMLYEPYDGSLNANTMEVGIRQQRLDIVQSAVAPVLLYVRDTVLDTDMIAPLNLVSAIRQNPAYNTQEAIDRENLFAIEISILHDLSVTVAVNGWEIVVLDPIVTP